MDDVAPEPVDAFDPFGPDAVELDAPAPSVPLVASSPQPAAIITTHGTQDEARARRGRSIC